MIAIRNNQFFEATKEFIVYAIGILKEDNENEFQKIKNERPTDWLGAFNYDLQHYSRSLPIDYVARNKVKFQQSPKFEECEKIMQEDSQISKHIGIDFAEIESGISKVNAWEYLSHMLREISMLTLEFNESRFARLYSDLEDFFYNDYVQVLFYAPLYGFDTSMDNLWLDRELEIRKLKSEEKWLQQNLDLFDPYNLVENNVLITPIYVIELKTRKQKKFEPGKIIFTNELQFGIEKIQKLLTALRLFKGGAVGFPYIRPSKVVDIPIPFEGRQINISHMPDENYGKIYYLEKYEISEFQNLWKSVDSMHYNHNIKLAVDRFNSAYRKDSLGDKIIDYTVALESLSSKEGDPKDSITYKFSVRIARLCKETPLDREKLYDELKQLYANRSSVIHGGTDKELKLNKEYISRIEQISRSAIRTYLDNMPNLEYSHNKIINLLDFGDFGSLAKEQA